ncbi:hypothetical protein BKA67DRAFT_254673 [Truncatella angustata]|uniref:Rhodopsin domain-containing protein n=1 Tax=Truncatella angustata TaxID=152316 RepID=A0A9P8UPN6_9PEZI|nr:uncharacterized protein BKA67DRAFT_254673 [Truncatella angustata]KAH6656058.1 hypothetical protein BKA67DRAFT_254673 [Truncatella angustata]KAH8198405.1 hypothetical protein TruAng_007440 [Truncatella angustata]
MAEVDPNARYVPLEGLSMAIVVVSSICLVFSVAAVALRTYARLQDRLYGIDDSLVAFGTVAYVADVGLAIYGAHIGIGTMNSKHNAWMSMEGSKVLTIWILIYVVSLATIKSSICVTMLRIGNTKSSIRIAVWVLLAITWASFSVTFVGVLLFCRPIAANWDTSLILEGKGTCASMDVMIALSQTATASTIVTDAACVALPAIMLWDMQMARRAKIGVFLLLSFASLASITTICRAPYISHYANPLDNLLFWVGHIVLFSNIETAIGCVASSVPTIRLFYVRSRTPDPSSAKSPTPVNGSKSLVTYGSEPLQKKAPSKQRGLFRNPTDQGLSFATVHAKGDWKRLQDGDSDKGNLLEENPVPKRGGIRADYTYSVELSPGPKHRERRFGDDSEP